MSESQGGRWLKNAACGLFKQNRVHFYNGSKYVRLEFNYI